MSPMHTTLVRGSPSQEVEHEQANIRKSVSHVTILRRKLWLHASQKAIVIVMISRYSWNSQVHIDDAKVGHGGEPLRTFNSR
jgi:hypothetical protein